MMAVDDGALQLAAEAVVKQLEALPGSNAFRVALVPLERGDVAGFIVQPTVGLDADFPLRYYLLLESLTWRRRCDFLCGTSEAEPFDDYMNWPASFTELMWPMVVGDVADFNRWKLRDIQLGLREPEPWDDELSEIRPRMLSWGKSVSHLLAVGEGAAGEELKEVVGEILPTQARAYWKWRSEGFPEGLNERIRVNNDEIGERFTDLGFTDVS
jgi:hypothetical protein